MNRATRLAALLTLASLPVASSLAQADGPWNIDFDFAAVHQAEADLEDDSGRFAMDRWFASAGVNYSWDPRHALGLTVGGGQSSYEFTGSPDNHSQLAWPDVDEFRLSATARFRINDRVSGFLIPTLRENGTSGASSSDSRTWGLYAAAAWWIDDSLTIGPGMGVFSRLDRSAQVFPVLVVDWDINERWNLSTGGGLAASRGPGLSLSYQLSDYWRFALAGRYEDLEFRLDSSGPAPGGVGRHQSFPLIVSASLTPSSRSSLTAFVGAELGGELSLRNVNRETIESRTYDPALIAGMTLSLGF